jgi:tetratricopeptide (TPR) repeat protein
MSRPLNELAEQAWQHIRAGNVDLALQLLTGPIGLVNEAEKPKGYPDALALFAYSMGVVTRKRKEAIQLCQKAVRLDQMNPRGYFLLGKLYELGGSKKSAMDAFMQGLRVQADYAPLVQVVKKMGLRRRPVLPFLSRDHFINVALGRLRHKLSQKGKRETP